MHAQVTFPRWWVLLLAGLAHGGLLTLAFPPVELWPLAFLMPLPLFWAANRLGAGGGRVWRGAAWVGLGTVPWWWLQHHWLFQIAGLFYLLLAVYLAAYTVVFVAIVARLRRRAGEDGSRMIAIFAALLWVGLEVVRGELLLGGYAWFQVAHPLVNHELLAAPAAAIGAYGVSLLVVLAVFGWCQVFGMTGQVRRRSGSLAVFVSLVAWATLATLWGPMPNGGSPLRVGLVQTNLPQSNKDGGSMGELVRAFEGFMDLTERAAAGEGGAVPDVIVWPETMVFGPPLNRESIDVFRRAQLGYRVGGDDEPRLPATAFHDGLVDMQARLGVPLLVGARAAEGVRLEADPKAGGEPRPKWSRVYNSALMVRDGAVQEDRYDKMRLMAFGEYVPHVSAFPGLSNFIGSLGAAGWTFDLSWGQTPTVFTLTSGARLVTPICFEASMPSQVRAMTYADGVRRADVIVNLTNDGWFGNSGIGRPQHLQLCRWRAIETGVPVVRAVNTGISAVIDARGALQATLPAFKEGVLLYDVPVPARAGGTLYGRIGDVTGWATLVLSVPVVAWAYRPGRRRDVAG